MPHKIDLYKILQREPTAPNWGFEQFIVGEMAEHSAKFAVLIKTMLECKEPSQCRFILGPNGTGKTLLGNIIMSHASQINTAIVDNKRRPNNFDVLFSRATLEQPDPTQVGFLLARNMQRILEEPSHVTYASIATEIASKVAKNIKPSLAIRFTSSLVKYPLKKVIKEFKDKGDLILSADEIDPLLQGMDRAYERIQKSVMGWTTRKEFERQASRLNISTFIKNNYFSKSPKPIERLNQDLYNDLVATGGHGGLLDAVKAIADIAKDVDCRLLILIIDDFNQATPPQTLLPLLDELGRFERPKLLLVVSGVDAVWDQYQSTNPRDKSFLQKLGLFGNTLRLKGPSDTDIELLLDRLTAMVNNSLSAEGSILRIPSNYRVKICSDCSGKSYREVIKYILDTFFEDNALVTRAQL